MINEISEIKEYLLEQFNANQFLQGGVILTLMGSALFYLKDIPLKIWERIRRKIIFKVTIEETDELFLWFERWLVFNHETNYRNVTAALKYQKKHLEDYYEESVEVTVGKEEDRPVKEIVYSQLEDSFIIRRGATLLRITKGREKMENASSFTSLFFNNFTISGLYAKQHILGLLNEVRDYNRKFEKTQELTTNIYYCSSYGDWTKLKGVRPKLIENVVIKDKERILEDLNLFVKNKEWFIKRCIPYKRGYLFYGDPGNGKTTTCMSLAHKFKRDIYTLNLSIMSDDTLQSCIRNLPPFCVLLIEDIDCVFVKRSRVDPDNSKGVSFSCLLNCLDGALYTEGMVTMMTTNHIEKLDDALVREGRMDIRVEIGNPDLEMISEYLSIFYEKKIKIEHDGFEPIICMVDVQNICMKNRTNPKKSEEEIVMKTCKIVNHGENIRLRRQGI